MKSQLLLCLPFSAPRVLFNFLGGGLAYDVESARCRSFSSVSSSPSVLMGQTLHFLRDGGFERVPLQRQISTKIILHEPSTEML